LTMSPRTSSLSVGQTTTVSSSVTTTGPSLPAVFPVGYQSTSPLVASVSPAGVVTALAAGKTRIYAVAGTLRDSAIVTVSGPGLTLALTGPTTLKGRIGVANGSYYLECVFPMTMTAGGTGTVVWGNEDYSYDGGPFTSYQARYIQTMAAGTSLVWTMDIAGPAAATQTTPLVATVRTHYGVNASWYDYVNKFASDYVLSTTYTCSP